MCPYMVVEKLVGFRMFDRRGNRSLFAKARRRPGAARPEAETAVGAVAAQLTRDRIENWDPAGQFVVLPLTDVLLVRPIDVFIRVAGLAADGGRRARAAAGAYQSRSRCVWRSVSRAGPLVPRLLTETTLLGLLTGHGDGARGLAARHGDPRMPLGLRLDANVLAFTFDVSLVAGALLGLVPALQSTRPVVSGALRSDSAGGGQPDQLLRSFQQGLERQETALVAYADERRDCTAACPQVYVRHSCRPRARPDPPA